MGRGLSTELVAMSLSDETRLLTFAKLELDSGTLYLHNGIGTIQWVDPDDGLQDWLGLGAFGGVGSIKEGMKLTPYEITLTLSGLDTDLMNEVTSQNYFLRPVTIYIGALDLVTNQLQAVPNKFWGGFMDSDSVSIGEQNAIMIICENEFAAFDKKNGRTLSDADLQTEYVGDKFLEFLPQMVDKVVIWRGKETTSGTTIQDPGEPDDFR